MNENTTVNIAGYKFQPLEDAADLISLYQNKCDELKLKGTMLISKNGINFSLAGTNQAIDKNHTKQTRIGHPKLVLH